MNAYELQKGRIFTLGGKEIRVDNNGQIRSILYPIGSGKGRETVNEEANTVTDEFFVRDHRGSTVRSYTIQKNASPIVNFAADYDVWGHQVVDQEGTSEQVDQRFTAKFSDLEIGLDYFGARYYDAQLGAWISPDPGRQFANLYSYGTNPLNSIDPDGKRIAFPFWASQDYINKTNIALNKLVEIDPTGIISAIIKSPNVVTISPTTFPDYNFNPSYNTDNGAVIFFNPLEADCGVIKRPPFIILGHELYHFYDNVSSIVKDNGSSFEWGSDFQTPIGNSNELKAMAFENILANEVGLGDRYSHEETSEMCLVKSPLETPK